ncbi:WD40-repeat-containing domain protein [Gorgonomyces haynaldii]|nr:WD40-repeat-containing domain protein [Gorgonomyces haynaldii]
MEEEDYSFEIEPQQLVQLVHQETQRRQCTSTHWSEKYPHLVLATYNHNHSLQSDGLMFIWNLHKQTPEYKLLSTSDLTCAKFSPFHPYLVMGGTFSGQICIWDIRTKTTPVLKAPASRGHSHPVTSLQVSGSLNAHQLLTASNDGLVCTWTLDNLSQPIDSIYVVDPSLRHPDVSVTCLGLLEDEQTRFLAGSENGHMYTVNRYGRAASKSGIDPQWTYKGHNGIITSLDVSGTFVLTSSVDYTVKLWKQSKTQPLRSFEHQDHVYGVQWSPQSSCFASISGTQLHLYDLHQSEQPHTIETNVGLTSLDWDSKGERVACGSVDGSVIVIEHVILLTLATPRWRHDSNHSR